MFTSPRRKMRLMTLIKLVKLFVLWSESDPQALVSLKIYKYMLPPLPLLQGKHLPFTPSPHRINIFRLFVILSLTQLYRYTTEIFLFSTPTFKYTYPSDELDKNIQQKWLGENLSLRWIFHIHSEFSRPVTCNNAIMTIFFQM